MVRIGPNEMNVLQRNRWVIFCYATSSQNRRKDRSTTYKSTNLRGKPPLHYINEKLLDDTNDIITICKQETCYETNSQYRRKDRSTTYKSTSSRGKPPLHYITEQFLDDTNVKTSCLYVGVQGVII